MKSRARYTRVLLCALLLLSSVLALSLGEIPAEKGGGIDKPSTTTEGTSTPTTTPPTGTNQIVTATVRETTTISTSNTVTVTYSTIVTSTETSSFTIRNVPLIPGYLSVLSEMIPAIIIVLVMVALGFLVSTLILRSRSLRALDEVDGLRRLVHELRTQRSVSAPATGLTASSSLKRLLELGVLQPKEYMEKKIQAERIGKRMGAKQLMDEGLISQEQYDALTQKQE